MCAVTLKNSRGDSQFELQNVPKRYQLLCYRAQNAFRLEGLFNDLVEILRYSAVLVHLKEVQCNRVGLRKGEQLVREFLKSLNEDADLLVYSKNRLKKMEDLKSILRSESNHNHAPLAKLQNAFASNSEVERSFSKLGKLLSNDRNCKPENIEVYIRASCNH